MSSSFLSSMTFASSSEKMCDCDECGIVEVPPEIREAIAKKRQKWLCLRRTQDRALICREDGMTVWKLTMPVDAEPLVEFGSSHRLVWVQGIGEGCKLQSIGTGIIGSSDEEKSRKDLDWKTGGIYLVPSNGGKAMGWVHTSIIPKANDDEDAEGDKKVTKEDNNLKRAIGGYATLQIVKIPADKLLSMDGDIENEDEIDSQSFISVFQRLCLTGFIEIADSPKDQKASFYEFPAEDCAVLKKAFQKASEPKEVTPVQNGASNQVPVPVPIPAPKDDNPLLSNKSETK